MEQMGEKEKKHRFFYKFRTTLKMDKHDGFFTAHTGRPPVLQEGGDSTLRKSGRHRALAENPQTGEGSPFSL
jgi:hypothetical protein